VSATASAAITVVATPDAPTLTRIVPSSRPDGFTPTTPAPSSSISADPNPDAAVGRSIPSRGVAPSLPHLPVPAPLLRRVRLPGRAQRAVPDPAARVNSRNAGLRFGV
jgi:hypothetical protein